MTRRTWVLVLAMASTTVGSAKESLSIRVSPATSFAPTNLVIQARVEPDANNRAIEVVADSEEFYRASTMPLEGDRAARTTMFQFRSLPPGEYEVTAALIGADGRLRATAHSHVDVIDSSLH